VALPDFSKGSQEETHHFDKERDSRIELSIIKHKKKRKKERTKERKRKTYFDILPFKDPSLHIYICTHSSY